MLEKLKMRVTKTGKNYYIIRSIKRDGKRSSEVVERLGTDEEIMLKHNCTDAHAWVEQRLKELNEEEKKQVTKVLVPFESKTLIPLDERKSFNVGYLFLQQIYYDLYLPNICEQISKKHGFQYDLNSILSRLIYGRILFPSSKLSCFEQAGSLMEKPEFEAHQIYRALSVIADESDYIQSKLYEYSKKVLKRQTGILYYNCTNYFFEIEEESGLKKYGKSKEHRPNPIVQMGLFMDKTGIPLAFCINAGNKNEQTSLIPMEEQLIKDFSLSRFVVCTDAGLSSETNRMFNNFGGRCFITTQSIKKLKKELKDWCLDPTGWSIKGSNKKFDISEIEDTEENLNLIFYKEKWVEGYDDERGIEFNQNLVVTYSIKYRNYLRKVRKNQIDHAIRAINNSDKIEKRNQNDYRRFIKKTSFTNDGEIAEKKTYDIDDDVISEEEKYDGFYAVFTNLEDDASEIAKINHDRWEIEESFRIMKTEFKSRPVYLQRDDRIKAHFLTCFISLLIYRILEKKLDDKYTCETLINTLSSMNMIDIHEGYIPAYTRTKITDALHENAGFRTDYEIIRKREMRGICRRSKE